MADSGRGRGGRRGRRATVEREQQEHPLDIASLGPAHRANNLAESRPISTSSHQRLAHSWAVVCPRFIAVLEHIGFHLLRHHRLASHDPKLLTALVERWCPMTNTFHLPVGEMTITLQDVGILLGVRIDGPPLVGPEVVGEGEGFTWQSWEACCDDLLGTHPDPDDVYVNPENAHESASFSMGHNNLHNLVPLRWLRWVFYRESYLGLTEVELGHCVRAYALYMIGTLLLPDTSHSHVSLQYLPLLEDLDEFSTYSIGSSVLCHLYRELTLATSPKRHNMAGCLHLLQVWCWERIYVGRPTHYMPVDVAAAGMPLGCRWNDELRPRAVPSLSLPMYRDMIDGLEDTQVAWTPYLDEALLPLLSALCLDGMDIWTANVPLISWKRVQWHLPNRVMRQFGGVQSMDVNPVP